jgi:hypothetical protein
MKKIPITINYDCVICKNIIIPSNVKEFVELLKNLFAIDDKLFGMNSFLISYKEIDNKTKELKPGLKIIEPHEKFDNLNAAIKANKVKEIFISEKKYIGTLYEKPDNFEKKIEEVVFNELYNARNKIINQCLEYQKNSEANNKMNNKVNTQLHRKMCCVCQNDQLYGFIYRSILEPEKYYCNKCAFSTENLPPLLKIP